MIVAVVSGLIVTAWIALGNSYQYTTTSGQAREIAQDAMATMTRELRDMLPQASGQPLYGQPTILLASPTEIDFTAPYLNPGMSGGSQVLLTRYYYNSSNESIYEEQDTEDNGIFDSGDKTVLIASNIVNGLIPSSLSPTPLFTYNYYTSAGVLTSASTVSSDGDRERILSVQVNILADLNPNHTPVYMDLESSVQPPNQLQI